MAEKQPASAISGGQNDQEIWPQRWFSTRLPWFCGLESQWPLMCTSPQRGGSQFPALPESHRLLLWMPETWRTRAQSAGTGPHWPPHRIAAVENTWAEQTLPSTEVTPQAHFWVGRDNVSWLTPPQIILKSSMTFLSSNNQVNNILPHYYSEPWYCCISTCAFEIFWFIIMFQFYIKSKLFFHPLLTLISDTRCIPPYGS